MKEIMIYMRQGGFMMYPLIVCSIIAIGIILERAYTFRKATSIDPEYLLDEVRESFENSNPDKAIKLMEGYKSPYARIFARGLKNSHRTPELIELAMTQEAANEVPMLENYMVGLKTIITVSPLLGLLGTIAGMIYSFKQVASQGLSSPSAVMSGVSEALISTATGIIVAVIALVFYNYFANLVKRFIEDLDYYGSELANIITGRIS